MKKAFQEDKAWIREGKKQAGYKEENCSKVVLSSASEIISLTSTKLFTILVAGRLRVVSGL